MENRKIKFQLRIMTHPAFSCGKQEIVLEGDASYFPNVEELAQIAFDLEVALNEHLPQMRFHTAIEIGE